MEPEFPDDLKVEKERIRALLYAEYGREIAVLRGRHAAGTLNTPESSGVDLSSEKLSLAMQTQRDVKAAQEAAIRHLVADVEYKA